MLACIKNTGIRRGEMKAINSTCHFRHSTTRNMMTSVILVFDLVLYILNAIK